MSLHYSGRNIWGGLIEHFENYQKYLNTKNVNHTQSFLAYWKKIDKKSLDYTIKKLTSELLLYDTTKYDQTIEYLPEFTYNSNIYELLEDESNIDYLMKFKYSTYGEHKPAVNLISYCVARGITNKKYLLLANHFIKYGNDNMLKHGYHGPYVYSLNSSLEFNRAKCGLMTAIRTYLQHYIVIQLHLLRNKSSLDMCHNINDLYKSNHVCNMLPYISQYDTATDILLEQAKILFHRIGICVSFYKKIGYDVEKEIKYGFKSGLRCTD